MNTPVNKRKEKGIVLVMVLVVIAIITVLVAEFTFSTHVDIAISKNTLNDIKARYIAKSGVSLVSSIIKTKNLEQLDKVSKFIPFMSVGNNKKGAWTLSVSSFPLGDGTVSIKVEDERSKINLNSLVNPKSNKVDFQVLTALKKLFSLLGVEQKKSDLFTSSLVNWLDSRLKGSPNDQDTYGADESFYNKLDIPYSIKDGQIDSVEEIRMIEGMDTAFYNKIKDYVTVYTPDKFVNFSTASRPVMKAIITASRVSSIERQSDPPDISDSAVESIVSEIWEKREDDNTISRSEVRNIADNTGMAPGISAGLNGLVLKNGTSDIFLIRSTGVVGSGDITIKNIEAVIRKPKKNNAQQVISWKEK